MKEILDYLYTNIYCFRTNLPLELCLEQSISDNTEKYSKMLYATSKVAVS